MKKIARFFDVSTEYLLGRTDVMETDIEKQAISKTLQLSEGAIDRILSLQKDFKLEQNLENDFEFTGEEQESLIMIFDRWLRFVKLEELIANMYRSIFTAARAQESGYFPEEYRLDSNDKEAVYNLKQKGYFTLPPSEQMSLYEQKASKVLVQSIEALQTEAIEATIVGCEIKKEEAEQAKYDMSAEAD